MQQVDRQTFWNTHARKSQTGSQSRRPIDYFEVGEMAEIRGYLQDKVGERNLDIGGGSNSRMYAKSIATIDISEDSLALSPVEKKICFDLDTIALGMKLPFMDCEFDSATMISVWQYLHYPIEALKEIQRVARGGELFVINAQEGIGFQDSIKVGQEDSEGIARQIRSAGYETRVDRIDINAYSGLIPRAVEFKCVRVGL